MTDLPISIERRGDGYALVLDCPDPSCDCGARTVMHGFLTLPEAARFRLVLREGWGQ